MRRPALFKSTIRFNTPLRLGVGRNVHRVGLPKGAWRDFYHLLLTAPAWALLIGVASTYLVANAIFALGYLWAGGVANLPRASYLYSFFFSIETMTTVGYGFMYPVSVPANLIMTSEMVFGLLLVALSSGVMFARFSRPTARVFFSKVAVITRYDGHPTLMFRAANQRRNQIIEAQMSVSLLRNETSPEGYTNRRFHDLTLVRAKTPVFALSWSVMHRIDPTSPLWNIDGEKMSAEDGVIVCSMIGIDETFAQTVHARHVYGCADLRWGHRFIDIFSVHPDGGTVMDYRLFHDTVEADA